MPSSANRSPGSAGTTLLEVVVGTAILGVVLLLAFSTLVEGAAAGKALTADADLRARADHALERIARDLRSTQTGAGAVATTASSISFFPMTGADASGPLFGAQAASYSWTASDASLPNLALSRLRHVTPAGSTVRLTGEVESFTVSPVGASFPATAPQTFTLTLTLRRDDVLRRDAGNPRGSIRVTASTRVTVPKG